MDYRALFLESQRQSHVIEKALRRLLERFGKNEAGWPEITVGFRPDAQEDAFWQTGGVDDETRDAILHAQNVLKGKVNLDPANQAYVEAGIDAGENGFSRADMEMLIECVNREEIRILDSIDGGWDAEDRMEFLRSLSAKLAKATGLLQK